MDMQFESAMNNVDCRLRTSAEASFPNLIYVSLPPGTHSVNTRFLRIGLTLSDVSALTGIHLAYYWGVLVAITD